MAPVTTPGPRVRPAGAALALALLALALVAAGCSLFEPRDPEEPTTPSVRCRTRSTADSVIALVEESYGTLSGISCYGSSLDAIFAFHPDPADSIEAGQPGGVSPYANWNRDVELRVTGNLAADAAFADAVFDSEYAARDVSVDGRMETRHYAYHVRFQSKSGGPMVRFQGLADITLLQGADALWTITVWVDKRDASENPTWGRLRRNYRTGF
jgi:hypothetical protein